MRDEIVVSSVVFLGSAGAAIVIVFFSTVSWRRSSSLPASEGKRAARFA